MLAYCEGHIKSYDLQVTLLAKVAYTVIAKKNEHDLMGHDSLMQVHIVDFLLRDSPNTSTEAQPSILFLEFGFTLSIPKGFHKAGGVESL